MRSEAEQRSIREDISVARHEAQHGWPHIGANRPDLLEKIAVQANH